VTSNQPTGPKRTWRRSRRQKAKKLFLENALGIKNKCRLKRYQTFIGGFPKSFYHASMTFGAHNECVEKIYDDLFSAIIFELLYVHIVAVKI